MRDCLGVLGYYYGGLQDWKGDCWLRGEICRLWHTMSGLAKCTPSPSINLFLSPSLTLFMVLFHMNQWLVKYRVFNLLFALFRKPNINPALNILSISRKYFKILLYYDLLSWRVPFYINLWKKTFNFSEFTEIFGAIPPILKTMINPRDNGDGLRHSNPTNR